MVNRKTSSVLLYTNIALIYEEFASKNVSLHFIVLFTCILLSYNGLNQNKPIAFIEITVIVMHIQKQFVLQLFKYTIHVSYVLT